MSIRNEERILDATRQCVLAFGVRRTTLTEIARRARVSRPTIYRRWGDVSTLVADLQTREVGRLLAEIHDQRDRHGSGRERLVAQVLAVVGALREDPLFRKIHDVDPEVVMTYVLDRLGAGQRAALEFLREAILDGQADGSIRLGDPGVLAHMTLLTAQSVVFSGDTIVESVPPDQQLTELAGLLHGYLAVQPKERAVDTGR
ncbi:MAG: TetR family transcriptional regulator [Propionibacteriales bacterium]|nr:TetR family transcriptional regulator [Propionibacteriales bacterium]